MYLQDWFNTRLYYNLHEFKVLEFNQSGQMDVFNTVSEIKGALQELMTPNYDKAFENSDNESVEGLNPLTV